MNRFIFFWLSFRKLQHHTAELLDDERLCDGNKPDVSKPLNYKKVISKGIASCNQLKTISGPF